MLVVTLGHWVLARAVVKNKYFAVFIPIEQRGCQWIKQGFPNTLKCTSAFQIISCQEFSQVPS